MCYKIIQIIPTLRSINAVYENNTETPILGLALVEYENGDRSIKPIDITWDGEVEFPNERTDFKEIKEVRYSLKRD